MRLIQALLLAGCLIAGHQAHAFTAGDGTVHSCRTPTGMPVMDFNSTDPQFLASGFAGYATFMPSPTGPIPVIHINFAMVSNMPVPAQKFLFWHECGHHQNPMDASPAKEVNANCLAMSFIRQNRICKRSPPRRVRAVVANQEKGRREGAAWPCRCARMAAVR